MQLNITKQEAQKFLDLQQMGDFAALDYLRGVINDKSLGKYALPAQPGSQTMRVVRAALELNAYVEMMETEDIPWDRIINDIYRNIMCELVGEAERIAEIPSNFCHLDHEDEDTQAETRFNTGDDKRSIYDVYYRLSTPSVISVSARDETEAISQFYQCLENMSESEIVERFVAALNFDPTTDVLFTRKVAEEE